MNIILAGNRELAVKCLEHLYYLGDKIYIILCDDDKLEGKFRASLGEKCLELGVRSFQPCSINDSGFHHILNELSPDLLISASYNKILGENIIRIPHIASVNIHFSKLPKYRGCFSIPWAIINGENEVGVTIHHIDKGVDSGDIVIQEVIPLKSNDTAKSLYLECVKAGFELLKAFLAQAREGSIPHIPQDNRQASFYPRKYPYDRWIDWGWPVVKIHNFIQALTFPPYPSARTIANGREFEILWPVSFKLGGNGKPGQLLKSATGEISVRGKDGMVVFSTVRDNCGREVALGEFIKTYGLKPNILLQGGYNSEN